MANNNTLQPILHNGKTMYTDRQIAQMLDFDITTIRYLITKGNRHGKLSSEKLGSTRLIDFEDLKKFKFYITKSSKYFMVLDDFSKKHFDDSGIEV